MQGIAQHLDAEVEFGGCVGQSGFDPGTLNGDLAELALDFGGWHGVVSQGINQSVFLLVKLLQLPLQVGMAFLHASCLVGQGFIQQGAHLGNEVAGQAECLVVADNRLFDQLHPDMRQVALAILSAAADEILILDAAPSGAFGEDQATGPATYMAAVAEQKPLQIVVVNSVTLTSAATGFEYFLHPLEQPRFDDRLVPAGVDVVLVDNKADVVRVAQHVVQLAPGHGLFRVAFRRTSGQTQISHGRFQPFDRVRVRGVQLECRAYQGRPFRINGDAVDQGALVIHPHVQVPESGS